MRSSAMSWLGFHWAGNVRYASDYFDALYNYALQLINMGKAYVDSQTPEQIQQSRGSFAKQGQIHLIVSVRLKKI
jgi:glutaminyl-tRNA synthetase